MQKHDKSIIKEKKEKQNKKRLVIFFKNAHFVFHRLEKKVIQVLSDMMINFRIFIFECIIPLTHRDFP